MIGGPEAATSERKPEGIPLWAAAQKSVATVGWIDPIHVSTTGAVDAAVEPGAVKGQTGSSFGDFVGGHDRPFGQDLWSSHHY